MPCFSILYNLVTIYERRKGALICIFCFRGNASLGNFYSLKFYNLKVFKMVYSIIYFLFLYCALKII